MITSSATGRASALAFLVALLVSNIALPTARSEEAATSTRSAEELVQAALRSELTGPSELRTELLSEALANDPDYAPARWHSGYVKFDGEWIKVDEVPRKARANESLAAYRKLRDGMIDTADNHRALARWCHKNRLLDEERIHWAKVLEFERSDAEAIGALGLQLFNGRLLTKAQIDQEKKQAVDVQRAMHEWQPKLVKWRRALESGSPKQLDEALRGLKDLDDPAALPSLEAVFAVRGQAKKSAELNTLLVETVSRFPQQEATDILLRRAVMSDSPDVCAAAADQLKKRPMHAYVPTLIAAIPGKLKTRFNVYVLPNGLVSHEHELYLEGLSADYSLTFTNVVSPADAAVAMFVTPVAANQQLVAAARTEHAVAMRQAAADAVRVRVQWVLERTTGFANVDDPQLWVAEYESYNSGSYLPTVKPVYSQSFYNVQSYVSAPTDTRTQTTRFNQAQLVPMPPGTVFRHGFCFPAGTMVQTMQGAMPVEKIKPGDHVLSQNVDTGEIVFAPVQTTTLRPPSNLVKISTGPDSVLATKGHPFWVVGNGWKTAKLLQVGDVLHGLKGPAIIDNLEEVRPVEVYNLVVSENHNYFVGASQLLVHDNSPLAPSIAQLPGLLSSVASP